MAINEVSGNFQPPVVSSGSTLPPANTRAPSSVSDIREKQVPQANPKQPINATNVNSNRSTGPSSEEAEAISQIEEFQNFTQSIDRSLQFKIDEELGVTIVRVVDKQTDELIRQFPPEELINLSKRLKELNEETSRSSGVLLQEKV